MDGFENSENYSRFLIIGGGISGLTAASTLAQRGIKDFRLLEARKRLGLLITRRMLS
jgi:cation diffusion facilitator CzcD-associated flavoprotein CzcO